MELSNLQDLMVDVLKDLYSAEMQILQNGPEMAKAVSSPELQDALIKHLHETEGQVQRLEQVFSLFGEQPSEKPCHGMEGLIEENKELLKEKGDPDVQDAGLILGQQKVEHYEIASYGTAVTFARMLGNEEAAKLLAQTLAEEERADKKLTEIAKSRINVDAVGGGGDESATSLES